MLTAKEMAQDVAEEVQGFLMQAGISEIDFLKQARLDHHLLAKLRAGKSITTGTIEKIYRAIIAIDPDWIFKHELRQAVLVRAQSLRCYRDVAAVDGLHQTAFALSYWPRRGV